MKKSSIWWYCSFNKLPIELKIANLQNLPVISPFQESNCLHPSKFLTELSLISRQRAFINLITFLKNKQSHNCPTKSHFHASKHSLDFPHKMMIHSNSAFHKSQNTPKKPSKNTQKNTKNTISIVINFLFSLIRSY